MRQMPRENVILACQKKKKKKHCDTTDMVAKLHAGALWVTTAPHHELCESPGGGSGGWGGRGVGAYTALPSALSGVSETL